MAVKRGTNGADTIVGAATNDYLYGLLGNDSITAGAGDDYLSGNAGNDTLRGGLGNDGLDGGAGIDLVYGDDGNDQISGGADILKDSLFGGAGDDVVNARQNDFADGGVGIDTLTLGLEADFSADAVLYKVNLTNIDGSATAATGYQGVTARNFENAFVFLTNAAAGSSVIGSDGDDTIFANVAEGETGGVTLRGWNGDDSINGSDQADFIYGDAGTDILTGGAGIDNLYGGADSDLFRVTLEPSFPGGPKQAVDIIRDWSADDYFLIDDESATPGGFFANFDNADQLNPLVTGTAPKANSTGGQFLYNTTTGIVSYDADGTGAGAAVALFRLMGAPTLTASDFIFDV
jgi:Ca2+-binding RTX toxin-like protein